MVLTAMAVAKRLPIYLSWPPFRMPCPIGLLRGDENIGQARLEPCLLRFFRGEHGVGTVVHTPIEITPQRLA